MPPDLDLSLAEVASLARLAARGGGHAWGLADDIARSARWLAAHGADWAGSLLALLDAPPPAECCPFRLGCFLADIAAQRDSYDFPLVVAPAWLLPPVLTTGDHGIRLRIGAVDIAGATASRPWADVFALGPAPVTVSTGGRALPFALPPGVARSLLSPALAARLDAYAARTYVPASAQSRALGAGGGATDDD